MGIGTELHAQKAGVHWNESETETLNLKFMVEACADYLIHTEVIYFWDKIDDISLGYGSSLITQNYGIECLDGCGDWIEKE